MRTRRPDAHRRRGESAENRSVRAGTDQANESEGARGEGAARATKCHVRATSGGAATNSDTPVTGAVSSIASAGTTKQNRQAQSAGRGSAAVLAAGLKAAPSTTSHASRGDSSWVPVSCSSAHANMPSKPAASNAQCNVAGSQSASTARATSWRRRCTR